MAPPDGGGVDSEKMALVVQEMQNLKNQIYYVQQHLLQLRSSKVAGTDSTATETTAGGTPQIGQKVGDGQGGYCLNLTCLHQYGLPLENGTLLGTKGHPLEKIKGFL